MCRFLLQVLISVYGYDLIYWCFLSQTVTSFGAANAVELGEISVTQTKLRAFAVSGTALVVVLTGSVAAAPAAEAKGMTLEQFYKTKSYPFAGYNGGNSPAGFSRGWCADYAFWAFEHWTGSRLHHIKVNGVSVSTLKATVAKKGFKYGSKPKAGAVAVQLSGGPHFAYVYSYKGGSTFKVREVRWNTKGPSFRNVPVNKIGKTRAGFQFFIYKK